ncbi:MAG: glycosyltransferase [Chloroflexota bacterium]|nr:glycosyltransferase [Chloroflexota bacterium]
MTGAKAELPHVAYVMSRFPKLTETFILYEILALQELGFKVSVFPLLRQREPVRHAEVERVAAVVQYLPFVSLAILRSQLHHLRHRPRTYVRTLATLVRANLGSANYLFGGLAIFAKVAHLARLARAAGVDHVHCHFSSHPATAGFILHRLSGIPYSFTAHGSDLHVDRHMLCEKASEAAFVVAISEYNRRVITDHCGPQIASRVDVIHSGVDGEFFRPIADLPAQGAPLRIICVGSLAEVKGHRYLIDALRDLESDGIDFQCQLVGDGPLRAQLEQRVADAGLADRVTFLGARDRSQVRALMAEADVLVVPSVPTAEGRREGIPVVLMEGMASGLPAIASRISGIPELVDDGVSGLLVAARDVAALADALRRLHGDVGLRRALGQAGRQKVVRQFDIRATARQLADRIIATHRARGRC